MFNKYSNPDNDSFTAPDSSAPYEGFGRPNDGVRFNGENSLSNDAAFDSDWNDMLNEFNSIEHDSGAFSAEEDDSGREQTVSGGFSDDTYTSANGFDDGFGDELPDESMQYNYDDNDDDEPSPAKTSDKQSDSTPNTPNALGRIMVVLVALIFGIGVLFVIKLNNSAAFEEISGDGGSGYVTPSDDENDADHVDIVSDDTESQPESEPDAVSSAQPIDTSKYKEIKAGERSDDVLKMQKRLCELGYVTDASCTGFYGKFTVSKIKAFQEAAGLEPTGDADPETLARLYADDAPKAK